MPNKFKRHWVLFFQLLIGVGLLSFEAKALKIQSLTLAQVGTQVITSRDVEISSIMDHWFLMAKSEAMLKDHKAKKETKESSDHKDWILEQKSPAFQKQLSTVMAEALVVLEAENFSVAQLPAGEAKKTALSMSEDLKTWPEWTSLAVSSAELETHIVRHRRAKEFLKFKTESMGMQVSDEDAKKYYEQNHNRFNNLPFEGFKESIKEYLISRDVESKMKDWFDVLRKKYKAKLLQNEFEK